MREMRLFLLIAFFMAFLFCSFVTYRRVILGLSPFNAVAYGYAIIEALIMAKIILLGKLCGLGDGVKNRCLAVVVLYKALLFALFTLLFASVEDVVRAIFAGKSAAEIYAALWEHASMHFVGHFIVTFAAFVPFFSFLELGRIVGEEKLFQLFFHKPASEKAPSDPS